MSIPSNLFKLWAVSRAVSSSTPILLNLLIGMAAITFFAVLAAVIGGILLGGAVWFSYAQLLAHGMTSTQAVLIVTLLLLLALATCLLVLQHYWHKLHRLIKRLLYLQSPVSGRLGNVADAFMDGYNRRAATD